VAQCAAGKDDASCLTTRQADAIKLIERGPTANGEPYFFGYMVGSEVAGPPSGGGAPVSGWADWFIGTNGQPSRQLTYAESFLRYMAFGRTDPMLDWHGFDIDHDPARMGAIHDLLDATDPDLGAFRRHGGKMIQYHGWADTALTPLMSIDYYDRATRANGPGTPDFYRLFMIPGMAHCRGGIATDKFDAMTALIRWVENGDAPDSIQASRLGADGKVDRTRPLCAYPRELVYSQSGDVNDTRSYSCRMSP
jgi:feruloyl esterase